MNRLLKLISFIVLLFLSSCGNTKLVAIEVNPINIPSINYLGEFKIEDIPLVLNYSNGKTKEINCNVSMLEQSDINKLGISGEQSITIHYENFSCEIMIPLFDKSVVHKVTYTDYYDYTIEVKYFSEGSLITKPELPERPGYILQEDWYVDSDEIWFDTRHLELWDFSKPIVEDVVLVGGYEKEKYNLVIKDETGNIYLDKEIGYDCDIQKRYLVSKIPCKSGYLFLGFDKEIPLTMPMHDVELTALWQKVEYSPLADFKYEVSNNEIHLGLYKGTDEIVNVPESYDGKIVSRISYAFINNNVITSLSLPQTFRLTIGADLIYNCPNLKNIQVDYRNLNYDSLDNCNMIISTYSNKIVRGTSYSTIPDSVTSIGEYAFSYCSGIKEFIVPSNITTIGTGAFNDCNNLVKFVIPKTVVHLGQCILSMNDVNKIYCEASERPNTWDEKWNMCLCPVCWSYKTK